MPEWRVPGYTVLARHDESAILVAVKYLGDDLLADPGFAAMFRDEAAVLASLDDPNVVRLYEYIESPAGAAIVMELIDGVSVREIVSHQGTTTAEAALVVWQGSLLGLAAAHRRGVVHRDYKPENVLIDGDGFSKLTDRQMLVFFDHVMRSVAIVLDKYAADIATRNTWGDGLYGSCTPP